MADPVHTLLDQGDDDYLINLAVMRKAAELDADRRKDMATLIGNRVAEIIVTLLRN